MNESRQQLYLNLINRLLTCDEGEEPEILRANADFIDTKLVLIMERVVSVLEERDAGQQAAWLQELANRLAGSLGMPSVDRREERGVYQQVRSLERRFGKGHLYFAYHAAFPLALTPDLCYKIWANFQRDVKGNWLDIPWIAVADLLLSSLCHPVGHELYEMDLAVRNLLLKELEKDVNFGEKRIEQLSEFMQEYVREQINSEDEDVRDFATVQKWTALAYVKPDEAAEELASTLREKVREGNKAELVRLSSVLENLAEPLRGKYEPLLVYGRGMGRLARGDSEGASREFQGLGEVGDWLSVSGVGLPIPGEGDLFDNLARRLEWRRDNLDLIQLLLNCAAGEEGEILRRHPHLVDSVLVEMMRQVAASLREVGEGKAAEFLIAVADTLVEAWKLQITDWAKTQNYLGNAYSESALEGRAENWEQAIAFYQNALKVYTKEAFPVDWAETQINLGKAYFHRIKGDRSKNLAKAIAACKAALRVHKTDYVYGTTLQVLIKTVLEQNLNSRIQKKAINELLTLISQLPGIYKNLYDFDSFDYNEAFNLALQAVWQSINKFNLDIDSAKPPVILSSFVRWFNGILKRKKMDIYRRKSYLSIGLDTLTVTEKETKILEFELADPTASGIDSLIKEEEITASQILSYIEEDPEGILKKFNINHYPQCNCHEILKARYLAESPAKWKDLAQRWQIPYWSLTAFAQRKCIPLIREIASDLGYQGDANL